MGHLGLGPAVEGAQAVGADVLAADSLQAAVGAAVAQWPAAESHVRRPAGFDNVPDAGVKHNHRIRRIHHEVLLGCFFVATNGTPEYYPRPLQSSSGSALAREPKAGHLIQTGEMN